ncbi:MAG: DNA polymerase domain-containing protein [Actinomycetota bacterium]
MSDHPCQSQRPVPPAAPTREASPLFGFDLTPAVVAVEVVGNEAVLLRADGERRFQERRPFSPWLLSADELEVPPGGRGARLQGAGLTWLAEFPNWSSFLDARERLRAEGTPHHAYGHPVKQFMVRSGVTLFKGLEFDGIRRLQFDLETTSLRATDADSRILMIAGCDNRGREWVLAHNDERTILEGFLGVIQEADPDVLEGHNLFNFDIPYLAARASALGIALPIGRDGSTLSLGRERNVPIGGISRPFRPANIWGRHLLDTLFGVQRFDIGRGELESHALKEVAIHYGIAAPDRVYLDRSAMVQLWKEQPEQVRTYALQDVQETRRLADLVLPTEFYQSQMVPDSFQNVATGGSGEKINSLLVREYLRQGYGIPISQPPVACPGGHTEIRATGVLRNVVKADVESLYPSIMLHYGIRPESDTLNIFPPMLAELTARRLDAKARAKQKGPEAAYWDGLQSSFKILINSFYGYLGAPSFHFNDYRAATQVTSTGQKLVKQVADELERTGARVIEIDTDGVYFVPPPGVEGEEAETAYIEQVGGVLPPQIRLAHDGRYAAMLSLKVKNYVLLGYDGKRITKGASLRSRADERFGRQFLYRAIDHLIAGNPERVGEEYAALSQRISAGELPLEQFCRRERVTQKTFRSEAKKRSREVAKNAEVGDSLVVYQRVDGSLGLAEEYQGDEDRFHYLDKLHKFAGRLEDAMGEEFARLCPRPVKKQFKAEQAGQLSLFDL